MSIRLRTGAPRSAPAPTVAVPPAPTMRTREPGHSPALACLAEIADAPRSRMEKVLGMSPLRATARRLYVRTRLEEETGALLARLPADWTVLHSVPVGSAVVPHLAIGPAGVFCVFPQDEREASVWVSAELLSVDGVSSDGWLVAAAAAERVEDRLAPYLGPGIQVLPVVAFPAPRQVVLREPTRTGHVLAVEELVPWLRSLPEVCSALLVDRLADGAELPSTWGDSGEAPRHRRRFDRIDADIARADRRWQRTVRVLVSAGAVVSAASAVAITLLLAALVGH